MVRRSSSASAAASPSTSASSSDVMSAASSNSLSVRYQKVLNKIYDVPMKFASKLIHGGQCTFAIDLCKSLPEIKEGNTFRGLKP